MLTPEDPGANVTDGNVSPPLEASVIRGVQPCPSISSTTHGEDPDDGTPGILADDTTEPLPDNDIQTDQSAILPEDKSWDSSDDSYAWEHYARTGYLLPASFAAVLPFTLQASDKKRK